MRACGMKPHVMLRSEWEAECAAIVEGLRAHERGRGSAPAPSGLSQAERLDAETRPTAGGLPSHE